MLFEQVYRAYHGLPRFNYSLSMHEAEWADLGPDGQLALTTLEYQKIKMCRAVLLATDPRAVNNTSMVTDTTGSLLHCIHRTLGFHGAVTRRRGVEDSFEVHDSAVLFSLPRSLETGERARHIDYACPSSQRFPSRLQVFRPDLHTPS